MADAPAPAEGDETAFRSACNLLRDAARRATDEDKPLWLVCCDEDLEYTTTTWKLIAASIGGLGRGRGRGSRPIPGHLVAQAVGAVAAVHILMHPEHCTMARAAHYVSALHQMPAFQGRVRVFTQPKNLAYYVDPERLGEEALRARYYADLDSGPYDLVAEDLSPDDLVEINARDLRDRVERAADFAASRMNGEFAAVNYQGSFRVVQEQSEGMVFLAKESAAALRANAFWEDHTGESHSVFSTWMKSPQRNTYEGVVFQPEPPTVPVMHIGYKRVRPGTRLNLWRGWCCHIDPKEERPKGSYDRFLEHWFENVAGGNEEYFAWQWAWLSQMVREPEWKPGTAMAMRGLPGVGKTKMGQVVTRLLHPAHGVVIASREHLVGRFNAHIAEKLLICVEEAVWAGDPQAKARLKDLVTGDRMLLEKKGIDAFMIPNWVRLIFTSNEDWVVPAEFEERRFAIFDVGTGRQKQNDWFAALDAELAKGGYRALLHDLLHDEQHVTDLIGDPAVIPTTAALIQQKLLGQDTVGRWWADRLTAGEIGHGGTWPTTYSCEGMYDLYRDATARLGRGKPIDSAAFGRRLHQLVPLVVSRPRTGDGERRRVYTLPALKAARDAFEGHVGGKVPWPDA